MRPLLLLAQLALLAVSADPASAQGAPPAGAAAATSAGLVVRRSDGTTTTLTLAQIAALPHQTVTATVRGTTSQFSGVPLTAILTAAAVGQVDSIGGLRMRLIVLVTGADGYRVAFSLAELDRTIGRRQALVVDKVDGAPVRGDDGPLRLIVPEDARPARWVRSILRIDVIYPP